MRGEHERVRGTNTDEQSQHTRIEVELLEELLDGGAALAAQIRRGLAQDLLPADSAAALARRLGDAIAEEVDRGARDIGARGRIVRSQRDGDEPDLDAVKEGLAGNLCRCGTYPNVFKAVLDTAEGR